MALHTIFGSTPHPGTFATFNDGGSSSALMTQFYITGAPVRTGWTVVGVRIWVPVGSPLVGRTGAVSVIRRSEALGGKFVYPQSPPNLFLDGGGYRAFTEPLVVGWNDRPVATPFPINNDDGILVGYNLGGSYLFSTDAPQPAQPSATASNLYLAVHGTSSGEVNRAWYSPNFTSNLTGTAARSYGIDIIVDDGESPAIPTGSFSGTYGYGPAGFSATSPVSGVFNGEYGWRPASAAGSASAAGAFSTQYGWGNAVFTGVIVPGGIFTGEYGWRPAAMGGAAEPLGSFMSGYRWGPAGFGGEAAVGGFFVGTYGWGVAGFVGPYVPAEFCWPDYICLTEEAPRFTLSPEGPCLTLTEEDTC